MRTPENKDPIRYCNAKPRATAIALVIPAIALKSIFKMLQTIKAEAIHNALLITVMMKYFAEMSISGPRFFKPIAFLSIQPTNLITK